MSAFTAVLESAFTALESTLDAYEAGLVFEDVGTVTYVGEGILRVKGLPGVSSHELLDFAGGVAGMAFDLRRMATGVVLLGDPQRVPAGSEVCRTRRVVDVPVGEGLLGRVVDATGAPIDEQGDLDSSERWPIERPAPAIMDRSPVSRPLQTGIKVIDALIPVGRGQRELILGDRQTGKSTIAVDTIINQSDSQVVSIYCAIGQQDKAVARVIDELRRQGALEQAIVVVASGEEPPGLQFVAPYAATTMAEYFVGQGRDALIVYDDLTRHARAYRELSLLLRRPPGREAYPGDIFYIHSRLLERATQLRSEQGGGSLTALPIIETQAQNISAYIPTNLISITDGQIYLSPDLFQKGILPAIDPGQSVSRVGGKAQLPAYRTVAGDLRLSYSQFQDLESFARFGARLDEETRRTLERGRRVREVLQQRQHDPVPVAEQIAVLLATTHGVFDELDPQSVRRVARRIRHEFGRQFPDLGRNIRSGEALSEEEQEQMLRLARQVADSVFE